MSTTARRWRMASEGVLLSTGTRRVVFKAVAANRNRSSMGGVGTPVVVCTGPAVGGVGAGASVLSVLWLLSVVGSGVVVSTGVVVVVSVVGGLVSALIVVISGVVEVSSVLIEVVLASVLVVVVTVEASVLPPVLKNSSLQASNGASLGSCSQSSQT